MFLSAFYDGFIIYHEHRESTVSGSISHSTMMNVEDNQILIPGSSKWIQPGKPTERFQK